MSYDNKLLGLLFGYYRQRVLDLLLLQQALQGLSPQIRFALLFGSLARGSETPGSDVDVMIVGDAGFAEVVKALYPAQELLQREINPVVYSDSEFLLRLQNKEPLLLEVLSKPRLFLLGSEYDFAEFAVHQ
jgi:predicted nucleotidyltransferase